ncbi:MAG: hypothetical protein ACJA08_000294 [Cyclobacteriaceae bacterium]|jgi:hypothetical protein
MLRSTILMLAFFFSTLAYAQLGATFPDLEGESLVHGMVNIPTDVQGKYTLVGIALSKKSETSLKSWFNPVYQQLIKKPEAGLLFAFDYDVNVYFVPMLTGAKRPAYQKVMDKVEKDVDKKLHPNVLFYKGSLDDYKKSLNIDDKDIPYFYLLDAEGKIVYATTGSYSEGKLQKIIDKLPFD